MSSIQHICAVCAWRATCQKKYSMSGRDMRCPDFVRDMLLEEKGGEKEQKDEKKDKG